MVWFLVRRAVWLVISLVVASVVIFLLLRLLPGDVATTIGGTKSSPEQIATIRSQLGLDKPLLAQYFSWVNGIFHADLGTSPLNGASVSGEIGLKAEVTLPLAVGSVVVALVVAVPLGIWAAVRARRLDGAAISALSQLGIAIPSLWLALLLVAVFAVGLRWLPAQGFPSDGWSSPGDAFRSLVLPCLALGLTEGAVLLRFVRSATLGVLTSDYLRTARAMGNPYWKALLRHGIRNASGPVVAILGLQFAALLGGTIVVERVFTLPGIGSMIFDDVTRRDLVKVQGELLLTVAAVLVVLFIVDITHRILDPRAGADR